MSYAYLGPEGTFTQAALRQLIEREGESGDVAQLPFPTVPAALDAVRRGECGAAVVPLENSVRGVVPATMDQLVGSVAELHISGEVEVAVSFALLAPAGTRLAEVTRVLSHPHALAQCAGWLAEHCPQAETVAADSTATAAREVGAGAADGRDVIAAIAAPHAAGLYGLDVVADGLGAHPDAVTRFVRVSQAWLPAGRTRRDRTSLVVSPGADGPGRLVDILTAFQSRGIAPSWIQPWPIGDRLGSYRFFIDVAGHIENPPVREAVAALGELDAGVRFLGSYPRWDDGVRRAAGVRAAEMVA
ncbi:prephenate dehydratase [Streptomyces sp. NBC_01304]|uniref:prephenate dehydratase n=1 Tax=Streptomyces sp. NBC_01304 TaxID=2903818 RepID=UPI002E14A9DF|nr:prephenate dehydratase [Streptomyces sp. NBC_01304]